jgi:ABC-type Fe3+-siderophore transport system permease subunit
MQQLVIAANAHMCSILTIWQHYKASNRQECRVTQCSMLYLAKCEMQLPLSEQTSSKLGIKARLMYIWSFLLLLLHCGSCSSVTLH